MKDTEIYYRNVDIGEGDEIAVRANKGYGPIVEIVIEGGPMETVMRLGPHAAFTVGYAMMEAAKTLDPEHLDWDDPFAPKSA